MKGDIPKVIRIINLAFLLPLALFIFGVGAFLEWLVEEMGTWT